MDEIKTNSFFQGESNNILYLSYDGMTDPLGQSQVLPYLIGLTKAGLNFHIISFEKPKRFELHREHIQKICDENGIIWHPNSYTQKSPLVTTIWDVYRMKKLTKKLHRKFNFYAIHCRSYISALVGLSMKKKFGTKFIFDMRGFWADERIDGGLWDLKNPIFKTVYTFFKRKEIQYFKNADYTISLTQNGKEEIESWPIFKNEIPKIQIIPCCVDLDLFNPETIDEVKKRDLKSKLKLNEKDYVIGYVGSIGTWYMLSEMLDYFKVLKTTNSHAKFLFVTGEKPENIFKSVFQKGLSEEDVIVTSCLHKDVPLNISIFDTSIFFIRPTYSKKASSPTKQGEIMAMGIPLVCNFGVGDTDGIVEKYKAGKVIKEFNDTNYLASIQSPSEIDTALMINGANEFYSLTKGVEKYLFVYKEIYGKK
jgi:glycosyltransferase involved in cell wall biosynthesis